MAAAAAGEEEAEAEVEELAVAANALAISGSTPSFLPPKLRKSLLRLMLGISKGSEAKVASLADAASCPLLLAAFPGLAAAPASTPTPCNPVASLPNRCEL